MFNGLTAWFSRSVSRTKRQKWFDGGGNEAGVDSAQYIFSQNASSPDTQRVFESASYLDEHLSVIHANYISECIKKGDRESVALGKYVLVPEAVQDVVHHETGARVNWEMDGNTSDGQSLHSDSEEELPPESEVTSSRLAKNSRRSSIQQVGTNATQSNRTQNQSKTIPVDKQNENQSLSESDSITQSKTVGCKNSLIGKQLNQTKERNQDNTLREVITNGQVGDKVSTEKLLKQGSQMKPFTGVTKHKQITEDGATVEKKQKLSADAVDAANKEEIWRLENLAKVMDKIEDFSVGHNGYDVYNKRKKIVD